MTKDWNPELYLKFNRERTQPSIDLVSRIEIDNPKRIIDIGCGPGNSTQILASRWPAAKITGVDKSAVMIEKAKLDYPLQQWKIVDAGIDDIPGTFDVIFSNATIQWIPRHDVLINKLYNMVENGGILAVQIPLFWDMPLGKSITEISKIERWCEATKGVVDMFIIHNASFYYDELSKHFHTIELWQTDYYHIMDSHNAILEMIKSTGLKPFLERLDDDQNKAAFEQFVLEGIVRDYSLQKNDKVLFPFKRLFFIAKK